MRVDSGGAEDRGFWTTVGAGAGAGVLDMVCSLAVDQVDRDRDLEKADDSPGRFFVNLVL